MLSSSATEIAFESDVTGVRSRRDLVIVVGPEAATYLHGQLSQNIERLGVGESAWSLLLDPQGRIDAWLRVTRVGDESFWLDTDAGFGQNALARLERFKLRTKAELSLFEAHVLAIRGPKTPDLELVRADLGDDEQTIAVGVDWPGVTGIDVISTAPIDHDFGVSEGSPEALEALRIELGIPKMGAELGEKTIPAEAGIVDRSTDFTKGCYVGQELVARVDSRGNNTPRKVLPITLEGSEAPAAGTEILVDGSVAGVVTSVAATSGGIVGLASIKRGVDVPVAGVIEVNGGSRPVAIGPATWI